MNFIVVHFKKNNRFSQKIKDACLLELQLQLYTAKSQY